MKHQKENVISRLFHFLNTKGSLMSQLIKSFFLFCLFNISYIIGFHDSPFEQSTHSTSHFTDSNKKLSPEILESVLKNAPQEIILLIEYLKNDNYLLNNKIIFEGPPGTGKTTLAQAIAESTGCNFIIIEAHAIKNEYQNSGAQNIIRAFEPILQSNEPCVVVIDEITRLTDQHQNKHNPEEGTGTSLWIELDKCEKSPHILVIGTTNDFNSMPSQLKSRFIDCVIKIDLPSFEQRYNVLNYLFKTSKFPLDETINDVFIKELATKTQTASIRTLEALMKSAIFKRAMKNKETREPIILSRTDFLDAIESINKNESKQNVLTSIKKSQEFEEFKRGFFSQLGAKTADNLLDSLSAIIKIIFTRKCF